MLTRTALFAAVALLALGCASLMPGGASARGSSGPHAAAKPIAIHFHVTRPQLGRTKSPAKTLHREPKGNKQARSSRHKEHSNHSVNRRASLARSSRSPNVPAPVFLRPMSGGSFATK